MSWACPIHGTAKLPEWFRAKVEMPANGNACWPWTGRTHLGYGRIGPRKAYDTRQAHRVSYMALRGIVPKPLVLDHLCRNKRCVNPWHLEPVTIGENLLRGDNPLAMKARQSHCKYGHPLSGENLKIDRRGHRLCLACSADGYRRWGRRNYQANAELLRAKQREYYWRKKREAQP